MSDDLVIELREKVLPHFQRFVDGYFNNPGTARPHVRIPAEPENDSDLIVSRGVKKAADRIEELQAEMAAVPALVMREAMDWVRDHDAELAEKMKAEAKTPDALTAEAALKAQEKQVKEQQQTALLGKLEAMLQDTDTPEAETTNATLRAVMDLVRDMETTDE